MKMNMKKRVGALLMAIVLGMTSLGTATTVFAQSESWIHIPFDFLFFHFEDEKDMTEEEMEEKRQELRELSAKAEKEAGLKFVYEHTMSTPQALSTLDLSGCKGPGVFSFADPAFVPEKGVTVCEIVFSPDDKKAYDYEDMLGWDSNTGTLRRYAEVICTSLNELEEEIMTEEVPEDDMTEEEPVVSVIPEAVETLPELEVGTSIITKPGDLLENEKEDISIAVPEQEEKPETEKPEEEIPETEDQESVNTDAELEKEELQEEEIKEEEIKEETDASEEPTASVGGNNYKPIQNLIPEITVPEDAIPEAEQEAVPEVTPTPVPTVTAPIAPGVLMGNSIQVLLKDEAVLSFEGKVLAIREHDITDDVIQTLVMLACEFDALRDEQKAAVSSDVTARLDELQAQAAEKNHTSNGVTVSGDLPWYVRLQVEVGNDTDTYVPSGLETIVPYEMCLWNLMTDTEYLLSGGQKVTLSMNVPDNIHLYDGLTIVHYMDETHYEYIELRIDEEKMTFETASFSPFNVAGSTVLVGGKNEGTTTPSGNKPSGGTSSAADAQEESSSGNSSGSQSSGKPSSGSNVSTPSGKPGSSNAGVTSNIVNTGDSAQISAFIMLGLGAAVLMALCVLLMKKQNVE